MYARDLMKTVAGAALLLAMLAPRAQATPQGQRYDAALGEYGAAAEAESAYPQDPADSLYRAARTALNREQYRNAAELFVQVYQQYPRSSYAAQAMYYQAFALYRNGQDRDLREAQRALRDLQRQHSGAEIAQRDAEALMARIEGELARRGDAEAGEEVARRATGIASGGQQGACEDEIRIAALNALLQMNSEQALPILERVLANRSEDPCAVEMRRKAVFLLSQHVDESNVEILLELVRNDPDREVRLQAVFWLSQVEGERTVDALEEILLNSPDRELQEKAIFALSQSGSARAGAVLRDFAMKADADPDLRSNAVFWIGQHEGAENASFLREIYATTDEEAIKERVIFSLAQSGNAESSGWLLEVAGDPDEPIEMRKKALFWAGQSERLSIEQLGELYEGMPERELKEQIIFGLSQRHERAAVDWLLNIARNETDTELRRKAIFWLSQSEDPRVAEFLLELIEGGS